MLRPHQLVNTIGKLKSSLSGTKTLTLSPPPNPSPLGLYSPPAVPAGNQLGPWTTDNRVKQNCLEDQRSLAWNTGRHLLCVTRDLHHSKWRHGCPPLPRLKGRWEALRAPEDSWGAMSQNSARYYLGCVQALVCTLLLFFLSLAAALGIFYLQCGIFSCGTGTLSCIM